MQDGTVPLKIQQKTSKNYGYREAAHNLLKCSRCGAPLVDVLAIKPEVPVTLKYQADCPHCGDHSYPVEVTGITAIGLHADPDEAHTLWVGMTTSGDIVKLSTKKGPKSYVPKR